jgi:hypothetical protein
VRGRLSLENAASQQTVDGLQAALEIGARSSYVPSAPTGVRSGFPEHARPTRLELQVWNCKSGIASLELRAWNL